MQSTDNAIIQINSTSITPDTTVLSTSAAPVVTAATSSLTTATVTSTIIPNNRYSYINNKFYYTCANLDQCNIGEN